MSDVPNFAERIAAYFKARPNQWLSAVELEPIGGRQAWRSRVSDARRSGLDIRNRQRMVARADGTKWRLSEYKLVVETEAGRLF